MSRQDEIFIAQSTRQFLAPLVVGGDILLLMEQVFHCDSFCSKHLAPGAFLSQRSYKLNFALTILAL